MGFALPIIDPKCSQNVFDSGGYLHGSVVAGELVHCSPFSDDILKGIDKFRRASHTKTIEDKQFAANKDLGVFAAAVNGWDFSFNGVSGNRFVATSNIEGRVG